MSKVTSLFLVVIIAFVVAQDEILNVYVVPHSHNDVGWLETTQVYFDKCVRIILDSVVGILHNQQDKKFIWVETKFFEMWWNSTTAEKRDMFRTILQRKQFEFIDGGWCMNDEATPTYIGIINQLTLGHTWLKQHLNVSPQRVGWQLDPFGYSSVMASLFHKMGFSDHVIVRVSNNLKDVLRREKNLQFKWKTSNTNPRSEIDTTILVGHYAPPHGFKWEASWPMGHDFGQNPPVTQENIKNRADTLVAALKRWSLGYKTNHIIYPFGDDFTFMIGHHNFNNMTLLMDYINARKDTYKTNLKYSLLSEYFSAVPRDHFQPRGGDFYPYQDGTNAYWTGYFTSYPIIKESARLGERISRSAEILYTLASHLKPTGFDNLIPLRQANAEMQHHDALTGTAKRHVREDYLKHMDSGVQKAIVVAKDSLQALISKRNNANVLLDYSSKHIVSSYNTPSFVVYNSLGWRRVEGIRVCSKLKISGILLGSTSVPFEQFEFNELEGYPFTVYFNTSVPALGYAIYQFTPVNQIKLQPVTAEIQDEIKISTDLQTVDFKHVQLEFCDYRLCSIKNTITGEKQQYKQDVIPPSNI
jgi:hypothetical protein